MRQAVLGWKMGIIAVLTGLLVIGGGFAVWSAAGDDYEAAYRQGVAAYRAGRFSEALASFEQVQRSAPATASMATNTRYYQAVIYDRLAQPAKALPHYKAVVEKGAESKVLGYAKLRYTALSKTEPAIAEPAEEQADAGEAGANLAVVSRVPLKNYKNALMVDVTLINRTNGKRVTGTFIIDTGATYTSISQDMADQLGLSPMANGDVHITTANGRIRVPKVSVDRVNVNGLMAEDVEATIIDVRKGSSFSGLLGLNFLKRFKLTIDPQAMELTFQPAD